MGFKFSQSSTSSSSDMVDTPDTSNEDSLNAHHLLSNRENDRTSSYDLLPLAEPLIALNEPQTIIFQEENNADLQHNREITTSVEEAHTVAESPCTALDLSLKPVERKTSAKKIQVKLPSLRISNALRSKSETSGYETHFLSQPVKLSSDTTTTDKKLTSTLHHPTKLNQPNLSFAAKSQSDELNDNFSTLQLPVQNNATVPDAIQSSTPGVKSSKNINQSNQLVKLSPVGSTIGIQPNIVRSRFKQIHLTSKACGKSVPIKLTPSSMLKRLKRSTKVATNSTTTLKQKHPTEIESSYTHATKTTLKRKNKENVFPLTPSKVLKLERPLQVTMPKIDGYSTLTLPALPEISIQRFASVGDAKESDAIVGVNLTLNSEHSSKINSFSDCCKFLEKNNVTITKVPRKPYNQILEKYKKIFKKNNLQVSRVNKNHYSQTYT